MKTKTKKYLLLFLVGLTILLCSCSNKNDGESSSDGFLDKYRELENTFGGMLVLGVTDESEEKTDGGIIFIDNISDTLNIQFGNLTDKDSEYILKMFIDYEEISFKLKDEIVSSHTFTMKAKEGTTIPLSLISSSTMKNSHILTVAVLSAPNKHADEIDLMSNSYGMCIDFELSKRGNNREILNRTKAEEPDNYINSTYQGIVISNVFNPEKDENNNVKLPPKHINVKKDEIVKLAYRAGNYESTEDILIVVLVDWKQQHIEHVKNKEGYISYGEFEFQAPSVAGKYEVTAFIAQNPYMLRDGNNFHTNDTSYRFTLIVE